MKSCPEPWALVNMRMNAEYLVAQGNDLRSQRNYSQALRCYALAFAEDMNCASAFNNYGNVLREIGLAERSIPFLEHAILLDPSNITAKFNRAVSLLTMGNYRDGWPAYEARWQYEHLAGTEPQFDKPRWNGQDLKGKTILVVGEQGHGDNIQFSRFLWNLHVAGARIHLQVTDGLIPLLSHSAILESVSSYGASTAEFDYWIPIMSIPGVLGVTLENLPRPVNYITARDDLMRDWQQTLGPKTGLRAGISWSGRRDSWLNQHKSVPFELIHDLIQKHPQINWINLQIDADPSECEALAKAGVRMFPGAVTGFHHTAALIMHMDVVVSMDSAVSHLAGALGRPTWIMLQKFAADWRWLQNRNDSPWYSTVRLFRQPNFDDWASVTDRISQYLSWFKV